DELIRVESVRRARPVPSRVRQLRRGDRPRHAAPRAAARAVRLRARRRPAAASSDADLELAQDVVQARLEVRLLAAPADDERTCDLEGPCGELLRTRPRHDDGPRRDVAAMLDRLR